MLTLKSRLASRILRQGGIIAYPTEGVWGLGCLPWNEPGARRILQLKRRPESKGMILVAASIAQVSDYLEGLEQNQLKLLAESWPGPVTWLVPDNGTAPSWIVGDHDTVALRVSAHPVIQSICGQIKSALISTSANLAGRAPAKNSLQIRRNFGASLDYIYPGELGRLRKPTEIRHLLANCVVRQG
ncbi:MAG: L-threonylcarbamoyladenylate synthase [Gammaproteobacteria bacterium]|nr:L-threonylcarbamoyladenylate synthase [Gammaproteobacteria bacterium]